MESDAAKENEPSQDEMPRVATPSEVETRTDIRIDIPQSNNMLPNGHDYTYQLRSAPYQRLEHPTDNSLFLSFLGSIFFLVVALVLLCPAVLVYVVFIPLGFIFKRCCATCCCCSQNKVCVCCLLRFMSQTDAFWLHDPSGSTVATHALFTLEKGLDLARIREFVNAKLICAEMKNGRKMYPRFVEKAHRLYTGYIWVPDENFSIAKHIFAMPESVQDEASLTSYIGDQASRPLSMTKPLWEMHVHSNYGSEQSTLILVRIHPCISDGISLVKIFFKSLVSDQTALNLKPRFGQVAFAFNCMRAIFIAPIVFLQKWLFQWRDRNLLHGPRLSGKKVVAWSEPYHLPNAMRIKQVTRSTLNDILLTVATGNLRTYLQNQGVSNPYDMHAFIPVDFRSENSSSIHMGNQLGLMDIKLPTNTEGTIPRLWEIKHRMDEMKNSADSVIMYGSMWTLAYLLPEYLYKKVWGRILDKSTCFITSLQGPDTEVEFASCQVKSMVSWMPVKSNIAVSISFLTYADHLCMTVIADSAVLPNPQALTKDFILQMEILSELLANRRIPGEHAGRRLDASLTDDGSGPGDETTIKDIQSKMREVQHQLQDLKSRLDLEAQQQYSMEEHHLVNRVEELKEEFRELLTELRRKKAADGAAILSDDEDEEDGELRRSAYRKRSTSGSSRRSLSSASTTRPLTTQSAVTYPMHHRVPSSPLHMFQSQSSTPSLPSIDQDSIDITTPEHHGKVVVHDQKTTKPELKDNYSPQVERKC